MKILLYFCIAFFSLAFADGLKAQEKATVTIRVDGLSCPFCAYGLEKKLKKLDGVEKLDIKINEGLAILIYGRAAKIDTVLIAKKVNEAGFTAARIRVEPPGDTNEQPRKIVMTISGKNCAECSEKIRTTLQGFPCVTQVNVAPDGKKADLLCSDPAQKHEAFVASLKKLGLQARLITESGKGKK